MANVREPAVQMKSPSLCTVFGSTGSGKSMWTYSLMWYADYIYDHPIKKIVYCYGMYQDLFTRMQVDIPRLTFHKGIPSSSVIEDMLSEDNILGHYLLILDDLQSSVLDSKELLEIATVKSHHNLITCVLLLQNIFGGGKFSRTITLQSHYLIAMRSQRDQTQLATISRQIYPGKSRLLPEIMKDICSREKYAYLLIDISPHGVDKYRLRTGIFPDDLMQIYVPRS